MNPLEELDAFYRERVPDQFNRSLETQRQRAAAGEAAGDSAPARLLAEMEAVRTSIVVQVEAGSASERDAFRNERDAFRNERYVFEIERGVMSYLDDATSAETRPPFLTLTHSLSDFDNLRRECGDSLLGFLGGLAGLGDEMRLTAQRVRSLRELAGSLVFERVGAGGFALFAHFGAEAPSPEPRSTIRIDEATYLELRSGRLDPQDAFMSGRVEIVGDEGMAIGLALAALSPD